MTSRREATPQDRLKLFTRSPKARRSSPHADPDDRSDLGDGELLDLEEHEDGPEVDRHRGEHLVQRLPSTPLIEQLIRRRKRNREQVHVGVRSDRTTLSGATSLGCNPRGCREKKRRLSPGRHIPDLARKNAEDELRAIFDMSIGDSLEPQGAPHEVVIAVDHVPNSLVGCV
jgi:hypothetical protein